MHSFVGVPRIPRRLGVAAFPPRFRLVSGNPHTASSAKGIGSPDKLIDEIFPRLLAASIRVYVRPPVGILYESWQITVGRTVPRLLVR